ncbi:translation initiation factor IF-2, partial [Butyricicoccus sp. 1XD8-22]
MTKLRVHEYAKKVNKSSKEVIEELKKLNINVSNHMSTLTSDAVSQLDTVFNQQGNTAKQNTSSPKQQERQTKPVSNRQDQQKKETRKENKMPEKNNNRSANITQNNQKQTQSKSQSQTQTQSNDRPKNKNQRSFNQDNN